jgi:hypothetical protein
MDSDTSSPAPSAAPPPRRSWLHSRSAAAFIVLLGIAMFFLWAEHRAHVLGALPYLLLLVCPLMHLFHHRGGHRHE